MTYIETNNSNRYYYKDGNIYKKKHPLASDAGFLVASVATALVYKSLPSFSNPFIKQIQKEWANNHVYKDAFKKAVNLSGLKEKGLKIINETNPLTDIGLGFNACFRPKTKEIFINTDKASISGFHELGHAMNNMKGRFSKILQKLRGPGYYIAGLMGTVALFSRNKSKDDKRNLFDLVQDNCGKIAFAAMLPTVAEESIASYKGLKIAKEAGLDKIALNNMKKFYGKALLSYVGYALVTGFGVFITSKIMELFTRPQKVNPQEQIS